MGLWLEPHWRPQLAKLPSFGGKSLEPLRVEPFRIASNGLAGKGPALATGSNLVGVAFTRENFSEKARLMQFMFSLVFLKELRLKPNTLNLPFVNLLGNCSRAGDVLHLF